VNVHQTWQSFLDAQGIDALSLSDSDAPQAYCAALVDLAVLSLRGVDAASFLQGYFTADLDDLNDARALFGAYCDIKGRVVADLIVVADPEGLLLVTHRSLADPISEGLQKYLMFSKSQLSDVSEDWLVLGLLGRNACGSDLAAPAWTVERSSNLRQIAVPDGNRWLCLAGMEEAQRIWSTFDGCSGASEPWRHADISAGIAHLEAATSAGFLPQMLGYDELDAISFTKGCYLGQEVVTRAQSRGQVKRRLSRWAWADQPDDASEASEAPEAPAAGADLTNADGRRVGTVIQSVVTSSGSGELLAVASEAAREGSLHADSLALTQSSPIPG
jgi:hypothetical protein